MSERQTQHYKGFTFIKVNSAGPWEISQVGVSLVYRRSLTQARQWVNDYLAKPANATVTVAYKGRTITIALDGTELSANEQANGSTHPYLTNASRDFIATEVEKALVILTQD
jgi:hypothetical protein